MYLKIEDKSGWYVQECDAYRLVPGDHPGISGSGVDGVFGLDVVRCEEPQESDACCVRHVQIVRPCGRSRMIVFCGRGYAMNSIGETVDTL